MRRSIAVVIALMLIGCGSRHAHTSSTPTTSASLATANDGRFEDKNHHFSVEYPKPWTERKPTDKEDVLSLKRDDVKGEIAVAVPKLPAHIPGVIPLPSVEKGYLDDIKKRWKNVKETETRPLKIEGAFARRFIIEGDENGEKKKVAVLAIVKGDTLYIMSAESPDSQFEDVRSAFEEIARSWKWIE